MRYIIILALFILITEQVVSKEIVIPKSKEIKFDIIRKNKNIGHHIISFDIKDDILYVNIEVIINVKISFFTIYKYRHQNNEQWKENKLFKISTNSLTNSRKKYFVEGEAKKGSFEFYGIDNKKSTSLDIIPISYWNKEIINRKMFLDSQKGILRKFNIENLELKAFYLTTKKLIQKNIKC